jgi:hypothetical protein
MPVSGQISLVCNYCGIKNEVVSLKAMAELTDWFVLSPAQSVGESIGEDSIVICRKCKLHIDELGRIVKWKIQKRLHPPPPDDLLPENDLPDTSFIDGIADPNIACIGTNGDRYKDSLPEVMKFTNPSWTKRPVVKGEEEKSSEDWIGG